MSKNKVFLVDKQPVICEGLSHLISRENDLSICGTATNLSQAFKTIPSCKPNVLIADFFLDKGNSIGLVENLVHRYPSMFILIFSMHDESLYAERVLKAGAKGYIMKTEPPEKVISAIRKVLNKEIYVSENLKKSILNKLVSKGAGEYKSPIARLSNRELEVFQLLGQGLKTQAIAQKLGLSIKTIETHIDHIKQKMDLKNYHEVLVHAIRWAITDSIS